MLIKRLLGIKSKPKNIIKPAKITFASHPEKKVNRRYIDSFWEKYFC